MDVYLKIRIGWIDWEIMLTMNTILYNIVGLKLPSVKIFKFSWNSHRKYTKKIVKMDRNE